VFPPWREREAADGGALAAVQRERSLFGDGLHRGEQQLELFLGVFGLLEQTFRGHRVVFRPTLYHVVRLELELLGLLGRILGEDRWWQHESECPGKLLGVDHEVDEASPSEVPALDEQHGPHAYSGTGGWRRSDELDDVQVLLSNLPVGEGEQVDIALGVGERILGGV
jgi:hypothetical protein